MTSNTSHDRLARGVRRVAAASARRPKRTIALWLLLVVGLVAAGSATGTRAITGADAGVGESAAADHRLTKAGLADPAIENVLVRSADPAAAAQAARQIEARAKALPEVASVKGPQDSSSLSTAGGKAVLVQVSLRGDPNDAVDHVDALENVVNAVRDQRHDVQIQQAGAGSTNKAINDLVSQDLHRAEVISLPITLVILVLAFGALVAAAVPLLLGITSVAAAMGALGLISQITPMTDSASSLVVLIGLAVGVDYSLFYIRREREERRQGRDEQAALNATAATVGRAVVVSGLTVMLALAGLIITGLSVFVSMGLATMAVVAIAVIGSVTVLPATLALLKQRIDRGRIPGRHAVATRGGIWDRLARAVTRRPAVSLVTAVCVLGAIAVPALNMRTGDPAGNDVPNDVPAMQAYHAIERAFPGAPGSAQLVVTGGAMDRASLERLGGHALRVTHGRGAIGIDVARDHRTAVVSVPMPDRGPDQASTTVARLRGEVARPHGHVLVTGDAARGADFTNRLKSSTPVVFAIVLGLALVLLVGSFGSVPLAAAVMGLNLLSVLAAYGALTAVFQHSWAESLLGFTSAGMVTNWIPLFLFVILFGLSMDYTVLVLERIREARADGYAPRRAAAEGVGATAGAVTSAAIVMVAIFAIFGTLRLLEMKELGVGLGVAVLLDATLVRGVALPAAVALLGDRGLRAPRRRAARIAGWDDRRAPLAAQHTDAR
jgi:uncharacterized membrane protein YdfJ with MMPL/SSD domain